MQKIILDIDKINTVNLKPGLPYINWTSNVSVNDVYEKDAGIEHYKLLAYMASCINDTENPLIDIGTETGCSAAALSCNNEHHVITYDIVDNISSSELLTIKNKPNIIYKIKDCCDDMDVVCKSKLILLDVDPHDGIQEPKIMDCLIDGGFNGILLLDDIHLNPQMEDFWNSIKLKKYDITKYGHWSGTGLVIFDETLFDIEMI